MKRAILAGLSALALTTAAPLMAQETDEELTPEQAELEQTMQALAYLFPQEPLTPEQQERLPQAERIVALMIPEGAMGDIMGKMIDDIVRPMMQLADTSAETVVARGIGVSTFEIELSEEQAVELAGLFDPAWDTRQKAEFEVFPQIMRELMVAMEPPLRAAMSEAYAVRFNSAELDDIEAFFGTKTGAKYARESFAMASDPRMMGASMQALPAMMESLGDMEARMAEATANLPAQRSYGELSDVERERIIEATGFTDAEIRASLEPADWSEEAEWADEAILEEETTSQ